MTVLSYVIAMSVCWLFSLTAFIGILIKTDPFQANFFTKFLFFLSLFFAITSSINLLIIYLKRHSKQLFKIATNSFLLGIIIAGLIIISLILWQIIKNSI